MHLLLREHTNHDQSESKWEFQRRGIFSLPPSVNFPLVLFHRHWEGIFLEGHVAVNSIKYLRLN